MAARVLELHHWATRVGPGLLGGGVFRAPELPSGRPAGLPRGRLLELAGGADASRTTAAAQVLLESQREGDPVAWIARAAGAEGAVYPPDLAAVGLDLEALLFVEVPASAGPAATAKATEVLLRTGAFGALAVDLAGAAPPRGDAWLGRLATLARDKDCRCVFLTGEDGASLGPLIATRLRARRRRLRPGRFALHAEILKDKTGCLPELPGPTRYRGPEGMP